MRAAAIAGGVLALSAGTAGAGPGMLVGFGDDSLKWTEATKDVVKAHQDLGAKAVRVTLRWKPGLLKADDDGRTYLRRAQVAARLGHKVVISVYGEPDKPPVTPEDRAQFCSFVQDALGRARNVDDVVIWNEVNYGIFWKPQADAAANYVALLAHCYDQLHKYRRTVNVITTTASRPNPGKFILDMGTAYRASGRTTPIFDTFGHNPYPEHSREPPTIIHPRSTSLDQGDYVRLMQVLTTAFGSTGQPVPGSGSITIPGSGIGSRAIPSSERPVTVWYLETGFETVVPAEKRMHYTGREPNRMLVQAVAPKLQTALAPSQTTKRIVAAPDQAKQIRDALELAYCQQAVGAFFNFQLIDEVNLGGWQSGLLWADGTPKPSYEPVKEAIAAVAAGTVNCSRFYISVTGPRPHQAAPATP